MKHQEPWRNHDSETPRTMTNHDKTMTVKHHDTSQHITNHDKTSRHITKHYEPLQSTINHHNLYKNYCKLSQKNVLQHEYILFPHNIYLYQKIDRPGFAYEKGLNLTYFTYFIQKAHLLWKPKGDQFWLSSPMGGTYFPGTSQSADTENWTQECTNQTCTLNSKFNKCCNWTCCSDLPIWQTLYQPGMVLLPRWTTLWTSLLNQLPKIIYNTTVNKSIIMNNYELWWIVTIKPWQNITRHHKPWRNITTHHEPWQNITTHHKPWWNIMTHHEPWWNITTHHEPWRNITTHHKPWRNIMAHHMNHQNTSGHIMNHDKISSVPSWHITEHHMNHHEISQLNYYKQCEHMWGKNGLGMGVCICVWEYESVWAHRWKGLWHGCV